MNGPQQSDSSPDIPFISPEMLTAYKIVMRDGDRLSKAWWKEVLRIAAASRRQLWEEALLEVTIELEPTIEKMRKRVALNSYDRFLFEVLLLLVAPNSPDPHVDRERL